MADRNPAVLKSLKGAAEPGGALLPPVAILALTIGLAVTFSLFFQTQRLELQTADSELRRATSDVRHILQSGIENKLNSLSALRGYFAASREVDRGEFRTFSDHLLRRFREIEALEWIPRVMAEDLAEFETGLRGALGADLPGVFCRDDTGRRLAAGPAAEYYPVMYVEPVEINLPAAGHDQFSDPERRSAMLRSVETDDIASTRIIPIFRREDSGAGTFRGFVAYLPVYKSDSTPSHAPRPPQILTGYVAAVFRAEELVRILLGRSIPAQTGIRVEAAAGARRSRETLLEIVRSGKVRLERSETFDVAGCRWFVTGSRSLETFGEGRQTSSMVLVVGTLVSALVTLILISAERRKMHRIAAELSMRDELTGLYNRRGFTFLAEEQLRQARRGRAGLWMLAFDLDGLKRINDTRGHGEGDRMIVRAAGILRAAMRDSDILARMGGDEFAALVIDAGPESGATVVENVRRQAREEARANRETDPVLFSIGAEYIGPEAQAELGAWLEAADRALYRNKAERKKTGDKS